VPEGRLEEFLFGVERVSLVAIQRDLRELQYGRCFYCGDALGSRCEVDHFVPWVRRSERRKSDLAEIAARAQWDRHPDRSLAVARSIHLRLPDEARLWRLAQEFVTPDRPRLVRIFEGWQAAR
jgi:hypothetical protein